MSENKKNIFSKCWKWGCQSCSKWRFWLSVIVIFIILVVFVSKVFIPNLLETKEDYLGQEIKEHFGEEKNISNDNPIYEGDDAFFEEKTFTLQEEKDLYLETLIDSEFRLKMDDINLDYQEIIDPNFMLDIEDSHSLNSSIDDINLDYEEIIDPSY